MQKPKVCVLRTAGTNCDQETAFAFLKVGAETELVHINQFINNEKSFENYQILAIPGGFTYGDDIAAGKILANELRYKLIDGVAKFIEAGKLIIGICNGFQILVKSGLLPGNDNLKQEVSLIINDSGKFEDRWVYLKLSAVSTSTSLGVLQRGVPSQSKDCQLSAKCVWVKDLPKIIYLPVAHGEGKFVTQNKEASSRLRKNGQIVFQYCNESGDFDGYPCNPNGSEDNIAGICDETGRILGMMPHPERHTEVTQHPRWMSLKNKKEGEGLQIFRNGVEFIKKNF